VGSLISNLTKAGVASPSGPTNYYDNNAQATQALAAASAKTAQPGTSSVDGTVGPDGTSNTTLMNNDAVASAQPKIVHPSVADASAGGSNPFGSEMTTKGKILSGLLLAAQGAARGAAASMPINGGRTGVGLGPALSAGFETPIALKEQQNELEKQGLSNKLIAAQSEMVPTPYGQMPEGMAKLMFPAMIKAAGAKDVANINVAGKKDVASTQADTALTNGRYIASPAGIFDKQTREVLPQTQKGVAITDDMAKQYGIPTEFVGKYIDVSQLAQIERAQAAQAGTTTNTIEYKDDGQGNIVALPKTTTMKKNLPGAPSATPGAAPAAASGGTPAASGGKSGTPKVVISGKSVPLSFGTDSDGNQVAGTPAQLKDAGVTDYSPLGTAESAKVNIARQLTSPKGLFALAEKDLAAFKPGELEALAPRWNEFLTGKVGTDDPRYVALRTHVNGLLGSAIMQAHVGARGGENMMEHFQDIANAGKMSQRTLKAALGAEREYVEDKAMRPKTKAGASGTSSNGSAPKPKGSFFANVPGATTIQGPQ
jgi:hypothetical protein